MLPLEVKLGRTAEKYLESLDKPTQQRISEKLRAIAANPSDIRLSKPLTNAAKRTARVGGYRIIFEIIDDRVLFVADIGARGQVYRRLNR